MEAQTVEQSGGSGSSFTAPEAREATRESLSRAYHAIQAREKAEVSRSPVIHDEARQKAVAERREEEQSYREQGLPVFEGAAPASVRDSMVAAAHRSEARERQAEGRRMPKLPDNTPLREALEAGLEWTKLPDTDKRLFKSGHTELESQREAARWFGLSLEEAKVVAIEKRLEQQDKVSPLLDRFARLAPGQSPEATVQWHADVAEMFRRDPQGTYDWLGQQLGVQQSYQQAAQHQQAMHQQRAAFEQHARASAARARQAALQVAVHSSIADFARSRPDFDRLEDAMVRALDSGAIRRTGRAAVDLERAYRHVGGSYA